MQLHIKGRCITGVCTNDFLEIENWHVPFQLRVQDAFPAVWLDRCTAAQATKELPPFWARPHMVTIL